MAGMHNGPSWSAKMKKLERYQHLYQLAKDMNYKFRSNAFANFLLVK